MKTHATVSSSDAKQIVWTAQESSIDVTAAQLSPSRKRFAPLHPLRQWLDTIEIRDAKTANLLCQMIPARCPFERTIKLFDRTLCAIPPLCKLNPFYEQVVALRFRALCYLADECSQDVSRYC
ncbi:MAG: Mo-dependent nitrogenase C-terminal domain-containing protein [Verrucomicrobia bacterium]|nr:Mo-dependent nitrogenase C-terminal domain-containing protein [Leptolyngbya sp. ES-bin-22]